VGLAVKRSVLITGATGFVGMEVLARYLERSDRHVYALVRASVPFVRTGETVPVDLDALTAALLAGID